MQSIYYQYLELSDQSGCFDVPINWSDSEYYLSRTHFNITSKSLLANVKVTKTELALKGSPLYRLSDDALLRFVNLSFPPLIPSRFCGSSALLESVDVCLKVKSYSIDVGKRSLTSYYLNLMEGNICAYF